jgi:hypothetical protein
MDSEAKKDFDEFITMLGLGKPLTNLPDPAEKLFNRFEEVFITATDVVRKVHAPKLPPVHFNFIEHPGLNAFAFKYKNKYFITISGMAQQILFVTFLRLMAEPTFLPHIGDVSKEIHGLPKYKGLQAGETLVVPDNTPIEPQDPQRKRYAQMLGNAALYYLFFHELTHIRNGHVDWVRARRGLSFISEEASFMTAVPAGTTTSPLTDMELQAIEMDADSIALNHLIGLVLETAMTKGFEKNWGQIAVPSNSITLPDSYWGNAPWRDAVLMILVAICTVTHYWGWFPKDHNKWTSLHKGDHPENWLRATMAGATLLEIIRKHETKEGLNGFTNLTTEALSATISGFISISDIKISKESAKALLDAQKQSNDHVAKILSTWKQIRPEILPYAFGGLAP